MNRNREKADVAGVGGSIDSGRGASVGALLDCTARKCRGWSVGQIHHIDLAKFTEARPTQTSALGARFAPPDLLGKLARTDGIFSYA